MRDSTTPTPLLLSGIDGSNPLGFLAALGTLRTVDCLYPEAEIRMGWRLESGSWRPFLVSPTICFESFKLCDKLAVYLTSPPQQNLFKAVGDNLTLSPTQFGKLAKSTLAKACEGDQPSLSDLEFLAAFGTDAAYQPHSKDRTLMQDTALRTMSGAGHQHFIKFMREIISNSTSPHLHSTLFQPWTYEDEGRGMNLRWDPSDDRRYAMRWKNPSADPAVTMRGANRLAIEALPLFPTAPMGNDLATTGFRFSRGTFWSWPIWEPAIELCVIRSLLQLDAVSQNKKTDGQSTTHQATLSTQGIAVIFRSQRITVGKFRNFTPAKSV